MKNIVHNESAYNSSLKDFDGSREYLNDLNKFLLIDNQMGKKSYSYSKSKYIEEADQASKTLNYLPKKNIKFVPSNLLSYGNPSTNMAYKTSSMENLMGKISPKNDIHSNSIYYKQGFNNKSIDTEYINFKTNFILKFSKNIGNFDKLGSFTDSVSDNNKKLVVDGIKKLKNLSEKKDRILFDNNEISDKSLYNWKENIILFYEYETIWQKITDIILKELKNTRELMIVLAKKNNELTETTKENAQKINKLTDFIRINDISNKAETTKKKMRHFYEKKQEFERKENLDFINIYRLEEE